MTWREIIDSVKAEGGFDATDAQVQRWLLDRARYLNAEAKWMIAPVTIGTTTAGDGTYALSPGLVDLEAVMVNGQPYEVVSPSVMDQILAGRTRVNGGGVFAPGWNVDGSPSITLWPTPSESGLAITGRQVAEYPEPNWTADSPLFPRDFDKALIDGAIAIGLSRLDERIADAQWFEERFEAAIRRLKTRRSSRVGKGPVRIQVQF